LKRQKGGRGRDRGSSKAQLERFVCGNRRTIGWSRLFREAGQLPVQVGFDFATQGAHCGALPASDSGVRTIAR